MSWLQLIVPHPLISDIVKEAHQGISGGHLGQEKPYTGSSKDFIGQGTSMMSGTGVPHVIVALQGRHLPLHDMHQWGQSLQVTLCRLLQQIC